MQDVLDAKQAAKKEAEGAAKALKPRATSSFHDDETLLLWALETLSCSDMSRMLISHAISEGWSLGSDDLGNCGFHLDVPGKLLLIDLFGFKPDALTQSPYYRNEFLSALICGLRDIWQDGKFGGIEGDYRPEAVLMLERMRAADSDTVCVLAAWELRVTGLPEYWRHLVSADDGDLAIVFGNEADLNPVSTQNGDALARVFWQWFADPRRVNASDHESLDAMDMILEWAEDQGETQNPFGKKSFNPIIVEEISCLPDGSAYLAGLGEEVCSEPYFSVIHDPINEAHLFQIVRDMDVVLVNNVPFRDAGLARKIFPPRRGE